MPSCAVACTKDYEYVFRTYRGFLHGVVYNSGVPPTEVEEAAAETWSRMLAKDGLASYRGSITEDPPQQVKAYLASYFSQCSRAELSRIHNRANRTATFEVLIESESRTACQDAGLLDTLLQVTSGDVRHVVEVAAEHPSFTKVRLSLLAEGWHPLRVREGVRQARIAVRSHQCTSL